MSGPARVRELALGREWTIDARAFWQVHPAAADIFAATVLDLLDPRPGERAYDLYGGAGIFAAALADQVGPRGEVILVENDRLAVASARESLADLASVRVVESTVERARLTSRPDVIVLDPPRSGAGPVVTKLIVESGARAVAYVACDPAAFARDLATFRSRGWRLAELRCFDAFPMTHHVECIGLLLPG